MLVQRENFKINDFCCQKGLLEHRSWKVMEFNIHIFQARSHGIRPLGTGKLCKISQMVAVFPSCVHVSSLYIHYPCLLACINYIYIKYNQVTVTWIFFV